MVETNGGRRLALGWVVSNTIKIALIEIELVWGVLLLLHNCSLRTKRWLHRGAILECIVGNIFFVLFYIGIPWQAFVIFRVLGTLPIGFMIFGIMTTAAMAVQRIHLRSLDVPYWKLYAAIVTFLLAGNTLVVAASLITNETRWNGISIIIISLIFVIFGIISGYLFYVLLRTILNSEKQLSLHQVRSATTEQQRDRQRKQQRNPIDIASDRQSSFPAQSGSSHRKQAAAATSSRELGTEEGGSSGAVTDQIIALPVPPLPHTNSNNNLIDEHSTTTLFASTGKTTSEGKKSPTSTRLAVAIEPKLRTTGKLPPKAAAAITAAGEEKKSNTSGGEDPPSNLSNHSSMMRTVTVGAASGANLESSHTTEKGNGVVENKMMKKATMFKPSSHLSGSSPRATHTPTRASNDEAQRLAATRKYLSSVFAFLAVLCPVVGVAGMFVGFIRFRENQRFDDFVQETFYSNSYSFEDDIPFWLLVTINAFILFYANVPGFYSKVCNSLRRFFCFLCG